MPRHTVSKTHENYPAEISYQLLNKRDQTDLQTPCLKINRCDIQLVLIQ